MKIIGICGSPRQNSNSTRMVEEVLKGAKESGAETEIIKLGDLNIKFCGGCLECDETGKCCLEDDMAEVLEKMVKADAIIFGTPTRWSLLSGNLKVFMDRLCPLSSKLEGKSAAIVVSGQCEGGEIDSLKDAAKSVGTFCKSAGIKAMGEIICGGVLKPGEVEGKKDILEECFKLGLKLASSLN